MHMFNQFHLIEQAATMPPSTHHMENKMKTTANIAPIALVLGITGSLGAELARKLLARGWQVRTLHRDPARVQHTNPSVEWCKGDAMERADVVAAAQDASLIVH